MRVLMLAENMPYPTFKGGDLRNWQNVNALRRMAEVGVFGLCSNDRRTTKPCADIALWQVSSDPDLAFPASDERLARSRRWLLDDDGHPSDTYYSDAAASEVERVIADFEPDVVVIERLWLHRYIANARRFAGRIVLDDHNIEAELSWQLARAQGEHTLGSRKMRETLADRTESIERRAIGAADQIWVCSEKDHQRAKVRYRPNVPVHVVPNGVDVDSYASKEGARAGWTPEAATLVFPAMFTYAPNARAARFLIDEVMPQMYEARCVCRLLLVGSMPTPSMLEATRIDKRIVVTGAVPDVRPFIQTATAVVVPLFEGSGTRYKILEAFAARVPVVTTSIGADGLDVEHETHVLLAQTAPEFAAAVNRIRTEPTLAARLTRHAYDLVTQRYSWDAASSRIAVALADLRALAAPS